MKNELSIEDVIYIDHSEKDVRIFMQDGSLFSEPVTYYHVLRLLNDKFVRINKGVIVNLDYALRIDSDNIYLKQNYKLNIDSEYEKSVTNEFYKLKLHNFLPN